MWYFRLNPRVSIINKLNLEELFEDLYNKGFTDEELVFYLSKISNSRIQKHHIKSYRKKHGWLANKPKRLIERYDKKIKELYDQGLKDYEIIEELGLSRDIIEDWRREHNLPAHGRYGLLVEEFPEIVDEWHPTLNLPYTPEEFSSGSGKRIWWKCQRDPAHIWAAPIVRRTVFIRPSGCPWCYYESGGRYPDFAEN